MTKQTTRLSRAMTVTQFDHGYWYATQLRKFAREIGMPFSGRLRKDELERAIRHFLITGKIEDIPILNPAPEGIRDVERGLSLDLPVLFYTNDRETKEFLERESARADPGFTRRSGARYRLNRWREAKLAEGVPIRYRDLIGEYVRLCRSKGPFDQIPHGRYLNFMSDFLSAERGATRAEVTAAWAKLKEMDVPKTYRSLAASKERKK
jgi:hypothetical protein